MVPGWDDKEVHKISLVWQIPTLDSDGERFQVWKRYTLSLHEKSNLAKDLTSWRGQGFSPEQLLVGFDVESMIGQCCEISVQHDIAKDGRTFANQTGIIPLREGDLPLESDGYVRIKDRAAGAR